MHLVYSVTPRESLRLQIQHRSLLGRDAEILLTPMNLSPAGRREVAATPREGQGPRGRARGERGVPRGLGAQHCAVVSSVSSHHNRCVAKRRQTPSDAAVDPSHTKSLCFSRVPADISVRTLLNQIYLFYPVFTCRVTLCGQRQVCPQWW